MLGREIVIAQVSTVVLIKSTKYDDKVFKELSSRADRTTPDEAYK